MIDSDDDVAIFGSPESWQGQFNRDGEPLTKMRRISVKHNLVNAKYDSRYRNASNKQTILGRHVVFELCIFCIFCYNMQILHILHILHNLHIILFGRHLSLGQAVGLVGVALHGLDVPVEISAHEARVSIFKAAAYYALTEDEVEEILETTAEKVLMTYLKGLTITSMRLWKYVTPEHVRSYFEEHVFNPTRGDAEIQKHLGLDMDKRIFDR